MAKTKKATKAKAASTSTNSNPARLSRAKVAITAIRGALTKGATIVEHSVRCTLKHPAQPKGVVVACFARQNHVVALLPTLGGRMKVPQSDVDRNGTPFVVLENATLKADAAALGKRIATALK